MKENFQNKANVISESQQGFCPGHGLKSWRHALYLPTLVAGAGQHTEATTCLSTLFLWGKRVQGGVSFQ